MHENVLQSWRVANLTLNDADFVTSLDILAELCYDNTLSAEPGREAVHVLPCWFRALRTSIHDVAG